MRAGGRLAVAVDRALLTGATSRQPTFGLARSPAYRSLTIDQGAKARIWHVTCPPRPLILDMHAWSMAVISSHPATTPPDH